jgi:adenosylmethionine-8-amino-7-oxononanoate aminotransferase
MAYHGDTLGSVSVGGIDLFHAIYHLLLFETLKAEPGDAADLERLLVRHRGELAAVIMEPLVQGAAGMLIHPEGYLRAVRELCDRHRRCSSSTRWPLGSGAPDECSPPSTREWRPT